MKKNDSSNKLESSKKDSTIAFTGKIDQIAAAFSDCPDFLIKKLVLTNSQTVYCIFLETLTDPKAVHQNVIEPLLAMDSAEASFANLNQNLAIGVLINDPALDSIIEAISSGSVILMLEGDDSVLSAHFKPTFRKSAEPNSEKSIHGPHEGFSADLRTNLALIRSKLLSNKLKFKILNIGELVTKQVAIAYLEGLAQPELLDRLIYKIESLKPDTIIGAGQLEGLLKDFPRSPFPQYQATERPDQAVSSLLAGKLLIILDGTPVTLSAPINFFDFFQKPDDLNFNWLFRSFIRLLRLLAAGLAIFLPALYVAVMSFHFYIIPVNFLIPLAESRARVPFPPIIEVLFIETIIEIIRESASRLATHLGATIGIMGGILLGAAAISTGVISGSLIIVSMVTLIASLILPAYDLGLSTRVLKFSAIFFAAVFGVLGLVVTASITFAHLVALESLGQPYFQPLIPFKLGGRSQHKGKKQWKAGIK